jgi:uncharacterized protein
MTTTTMKASTSPQVHLLADAQVQAWRNGGGMTRELLTEPRSSNAAPSPTDWRWRLSIADITADGPFSSFPGVQRWFAVVEGAGVQLTMNGSTHRQLAGDAPLKLDGNAAPDCHLINGPTRDLNVMLRGVAGHMQLAQHGRTWSTTLQQAGIYTTAECHVSSVTAAGHVSSASATWHVPANALLWFDTPPSHLTLTMPSNHHAWWIAVDNHPKGL